MRQFIVTNPNLSVGRPGDIVTAEQLRMTDEKLDDWVEAGYGVEIELHTAAPNASGRWPSAEALSDELEHVATADEEYEDQWDDLFGDLDEVT